MAADETGGVPDRPSPTSQSTMAWSAALLKMIGAITIIFPIFWAAYTYYHQEIQQRRQDFLRAYDIVHGALGKGITDSIDKAVAPIYDSSDDKFAKARQSADEATTEADKAASIAEIQHWLVDNIFVKDKTSLHDQQIQDYQQALRNFIFLHQYAKTDACTALVVLYKFREYAYIFWYYYPGSYNFDGSKVAASLEPDPAYQLADVNWLVMQQNLCRLEPRI